MTAIVDNGFARVTKETLVRNPSTPGAITGNDIAFNSSLTINEKIATITGVDLTASSVENIPSGNLSSTNVQDALNELQTSIDGISSGSGDVVGPGVSVNNNVVTFDGTTGKLIKDSGLSLSGSNTGDQTSIVGISGTKAEFNSAVTDGDIMYLDSIDTVTGTKTFTNVLNISDAGWMFNSDTGKDTGMSWASDGVMNVRINNTTVGQFNSTGYTGNAGGLTASTVNTIGVGNIELGHATDTTISRVSAGTIAVEGVNVVTISSTDTLTNKTLTSPTLTTPALGTPASGVLTNCTGTATGLTSGITNGLKSATTTVSVSAATAPTTGQVLTATSSTTATWQTPASGGTIRRVFSIAGKIGSTGTNVANTFVVDGTYTISKVNLWYGTAGSGTLTVDVNKNGTTIFATTKPSITTTNQSSINSGTLTTTSLASGDVLTIDIDAVPGTPGTDLYVEIVYS